MNELSSSYSSCPAEVSRATVLMSDAAFCQNDCYGAVSWLYTVSDDINRSPSIAKLSPVTGSFPPPFPTLLPPLALGVFALLGFLAIGVRMPG